MGGLLEECVTKQRDGWLSCQCARLLPHHSGSEYKQPSKIINGPHKQRNRQHTVARQKQIYCRVLSTMIVQFIILLCRSFIYVKILEWNVSKSACRFYINAPKVEQYHFQLALLVRTSNIYSHLAAPTFIPCGNNTYKQTTV